MGATGIASGASLIAVLTLASAMALLGAAALRHASRRDARSREARSRTMTQRVLELAKTHHGDLTATATASALHLEIREAESLLTAMADGTHVHVEVDSDGIVHYVFRELALAKPPAIRVDPSLLDDSDRIEAAAESQVDRALAKRDRI